VDFFIAAHLCDNDVPAAIERLNDASFVRLVQTEAANRGVPTDYPKRPPSLDRLPWDVVQKMQVEARAEPWSIAELHHLNELHDEFGDDWRAVSSHMLNRTKGQCKVAWVENFGGRPPGPSHHDQEVDIRSITFIWHGGRFRVGRVVDGS
jgi:hypothetical protein